MNLWIGRDFLLLKKVEVTALVSLCYMLGKQLAVATFVLWRRGGPFCSPLLELIVFDVQVQLSFVDVQIDHVSVSD